ncbi:MAG: hypothetical protein LBC70_09570 [Chitinispirillales bacterium]|jgi:hypothetical protein|nr:hypothetical protein [Chitinispirillales bacterium]
MSAVAIENRSLRSIELTRIRRCYDGGRSGLESVLDSLGLSSCSDKSEAILKAMGVDNSENVFYSGGDIASETDHDQEREQYEALVGAFFSGIWKHDSI